MNFKSKLRDLRYLNRSVVFSVDLFLACAGAFTSLIAISLLIGNDIYNSTLKILSITLIISTGVSLLTGSYKTSIRYSTLPELGRIVYIQLLKGILMTLAIIYFKIFLMPYIAFYVVLDLIITSFLMISSRVCMVSVYYAIVNRSDEGATNALIYGAGGHAPLIAAQINNNTKSPYRVMGYLSTDYKKRTVRIAGKPVYCWDNDFAQLESIIVKHNITHILFTNNDDFNLERNRLVDFCIELNIQMLISGAIQQFDKKQNPLDHIKPAEIEDLLNRDEIGIDTATVSQQLSGKIILVTGAAGSIGQEITLQLANFDTKQLLLLDSAETPLHHLQLQLTKKFPHKNIIFLLSDVRSETRIRRVFEQYKPNFVFHAAAYKHVPMIEANPCEGVLTNICGTINTAHFAIQNGVEKFIMISTDKAVNPTSVMGATKRIAELWVQGMNAYNQNTQFIVTRFGNVLGSNGSVVQIFREQIACGGPVTVTHPNMIRYFMTIPEACRLVLQAASMGCGGEIFIFDMGEQVKIDNLARRMILLSGLVPDEDIEIKYTGLRPGEKLYEELLTEVESTMTTKNEKIRIALAGNCDIKLIRENVSQLIKASKQLDVSQTIRLMKHLVPEFKSNNSQFEAFDNDKINIENGYGEPHANTTSAGTCPDGFYHPQ